MLARQALAERGDARLGARQLRFAFALL